ncbi:perilipin-2-like [Pomacea canaliculata]|uniref:perilipin-2-like n=1 Tax=Pomacea canaliculata TaxID=400727 RepID=UPI000D730B3B|nr:perilipin-2-like [Pomacea canaliculata]XP_025076936.1 perilipin-2-like [Pomacea canaliculata]
MFELFRIRCQKHCMYRQNMEQQQEQLFHKLGELPIVNDTCHQVLDIYERTKGHNFLFRTTFGLAEATARVIAGKTLPIITNHCQPQLQKVNNVACDTLDALEEKYPIITRPTDEVLREGKEKYDKTLGPYLNPVIRPAVAAVNVGVSAVNMSTSAASAVVNSGKQSVGAVAKLGTDTVSGIYTFGKNRVTKAVDYGLQTPYGEFLLGQLDASLSLSEKMLDRYLPEEGEGKDDGKEVESDST